MRLIADKIIQIAKEIKLSLRHNYTGKVDQSILSEFLDIAYNESSIHKAKKLEIAKNLKAAGKAVKIESAFVLGGIRIKPDVRYFEDGKWHIIEVERRNHRNKILRNLDHLSKFANIEIIY